MNARFAIFWPFLLFASVSAHATNDNGHIRTLASSCVICHGSAATSESVIPSLTGLDESYFIQKMRDYRGSSDEHEIMVQHAKGLTEEEIKKLASYFAIQYRACSVLAERTACNSGDK
jgi:sulfide dehydrogenase cytochrome subunit